MLKNKKSWVLIADGTFSIPLEVGGMSTGLIEKLSRQLDEQKRATEKSKKVNAKRA
jgi:hypothetical protein